MMADRQKKKKILMLLFIAVFLPVFLAVSGSFYMQETADPGKTLLAGDVLELEDFYICELEGIVEPSIARYIEQCLERARESGYGLIMMMDTPGGLENSMRDIITGMLNADIPVIVYVYPVGARAASAGVFITYAGDIAAMGPSTNIGAAHPVNMGGDQQVSPEMMEKVTNDSVSYIKNLARARDRNAEWAEEAVRKSVSITAEEALELGVIDHMAADLDELLVKIDGETVEKLGKTYTLKTSGITPVEIEMNFMARFLHVISNPNIAYILLSLGTLGIIYEFSQPGLGISGAIGTLLLILGLYALSVLPINYAGLGLIILAVILFVADILMALGGIPSIAGVFSLVIGSFLLINTDAPYLRIAASLIITVAVVVSGFLFIVVRAVYKAHRIKPVTGKDGIVDGTAVVSSTLRPRGQIKISGEIWNAVSDTGRSIRQGKKVRIISIDGLTLTVSEIKEEDKGG
jgi:membrane-bound serine protease (ClpP class)